MKRMMSVIGDELFFTLMKLKKCDNSAKNDFVIKENGFFDKLSDMGHEIIKNNECRNIRGLAISGDELVMLGYEGAEIGKMQKELLELVITEGLENTRAELLNYAEQRCSR